MTTQMRLDTLTKLSESDLVLANSDEDIRGRTLRDTNDEEIGSVDDLMIDADQRKVRFLLVGAGGFLGIGEKQFLIPVDAVTRIDDDNVWINQNKSKIIGSPNYQPDLVNENYYNDLYGYYGYSPYWTPGYTYPPYPNYRR
ncbi:MAG TPA: PRC-barrel domain-containing protein [Candidatus Limnocylindria bacterium]|nr:PRC-barrel domain-containing protein [Candidatus Limnocylindria bacterium]